MPVITIFSGSCCHGDEIARQLVNRLNLERIEEQLFTIIADRYGVSAEKLHRTMTGHVPVMNKLTREREKNIAYLKAVLAELIAYDNRMFHGFAGLIAPANISHLLKVCIIANHDYRVKQLMTTESRTEKEAHKIIREDDTDRGSWVRELYGKSAYDESLYDIVIPMQDHSIDEATDIICDNALKTAVKATPDSLQSVEDFRLAMAVNLALVEAGHDDDVSAENGTVTITINKYVVRLEPLQEKLKKIATGIEGVREVQTRLGQSFTAPSIIPMAEFEMPTRILLVDDEKEFVHTLSERLEARNLESSVVYDGEQALESVKNDEPEVMVLDLKMPGIDGIEVLRRVKREHPRVEVIILTGHGSEREEALARELGAFAYLHKPVSIEVLTKTMQEAYQKINAVKKFEN